MGDNLKHIDNVFREGLGDYTELPPPAVWEALEKRLDDDKRKGGFLFRKSWVLLLLLAFITTTGGVTYFRMHNSGNASLANNTNENTTTKGIAENTDHQNATPETSTSTVQQPVAQNKTSVKQPANTGASHSRVHHVATSHNAIKHAANTHSETVKATEPNSQNYNASAVEEKTVTPIAASSETPTNYKQPELLSDPTDGETVVATKKNQEKATKHPIQTNRYAIVERSGANKPAAHRSRTNGSKHVKATKTAIAKANNINFNPNIPVEERKKNATQSAANNTNVASTKKTETPKPTTNKTSGTRTATTVLASNSTSASGNKKPVAATGKPETTAKATVVDTKTTTTEPAQAIASSSTNNTSSPVNAAGAPKSTRHPRNRKPVIATASTSTTTSASSSVENSNNPTQIGATKTIGQQEAPNVATAPTHAKSGAKHTGVASTNGGTKTTVAAIANSVATNNQKGTTTHQSTAAKATNTTSTVGKGDAIASTKHVGIKTNTTSNKSGISTKTVAATSNSVAASNKVENTSNAISKTKATNTPTNRALALNSAPSKNNASAPKKAESTQSKEAKEVATNQPKSAKSDTKIAVAAFKGNTTNTIKKASLSSVTKSTVATETGTPKTASSIKKPSQQSAKTIDKNKGIAATAASPKPVKATGISSRRRKHNQPAAGSKVAEQTATDVAINAQKNKPSKTTNKQTSGTGNASTAPTTNTNVFASKTGASSTPIATTATNPVTPNASTTAKADPLKPMETFKKIDTVAKSATAQQTPAVATTDSSKKKPKFHLNLGNNNTVGVKVGFESGFSATAANKMVFSPFIEHLFNDKFSVMFQPAIKSSRFGTQHLSGSQSFYGTDKGVIDTSNVYILLVPNSNGGMDTYNRVNYICTQSHDSISKTYAIGGQYWEYEFPIMVKYKVHKNLSILGGVSINYSKYLAIQELTYNSAWTPETKSTMVVFQKGAAIPPMPVAWNKLFNYGNNPITGYQGPLYRNKEGASMRYGITLGASYEYKSKYLFDISMQQSFTDKNVLGGVDVNKPFSSTYFRVSLGYKLFQ